MKEDGLLKGFYLELGQFCDRSILKTLTQTETSFLMLFTVTLRDPVGDFSAGFNTRMAGNEQE